MEGFVIEGRGTARPIIYAFQYADGRKPGWLKVGYTARPLEARAREVNGGVKTPEDPYAFVWHGSAMRPDGTSFTDHAVHRMLKRMGVARGEGEWFRCTVAQVEAAVVAVRNRIDNVERRTRDFAMRPEQAAAVARTAAYFQAGEGEAAPRRFLWNAKMRFGKTFAAYQLARRLGLRRVLILTFKPAVVSAWEEDLRTHVDFEGWQFIRRPRPDEPELGRIDEQYARADKARPIVCFGSFQDFLRLNELGGIKAHHQWLREVAWDLVVFDEYHFGAWRQKAKALFAKEDEEAEVTAGEAAEGAKPDGAEALSEADLPITARRYLYLSGTPFRALNSGEFIEDQIYNWTYSDEQRAKESWIGSNNPYLSLPRMVMLTYRIPESIRQIAIQGEYDEFDLNVFFSAEGRGASARFTYEEHVQKWLDLIRGSSTDTAVDDLKLGAERPPMPFSDTRLLSTLTHTLWFLPNVASCEAMANLLAQRQNTFFHDYKVIVAAGNRAGMGVDAVYPEEK